MKLRCEVCREDLTKTLETAFRNCESGRLECPHCHHLQAQILQPSDLLLYLQLEISLMLILFFMLPRLFPLLGPDLFRLLTLPLVFLIFWLLRGIKRILYLRIPIDQKFSQGSHSVGLQRTLILIRCGFIIAMIVLVIWNDSLLILRWFLLGALLFLTLFQLILRNCDKT